MGKVLGMLVGLGVGIYSAYSLWVDRIMPLVPAGPYHGLIVLALGIVLLMVGGGLVFMFVLMVGAVFAFLFDAIEAGLSYLSGLVTGK